MVPDGQTPGVTQTTDAARPLGLPGPIRACLFDLDGVLTDTAAVHEAAWKEMFDAYLGPQGQPPFTKDDYLQYVDGKPRLDGVRDFLATRDITLPEGADDDPPDASTVKALGDRKNDLVQQRIESDGVRVFPGSQAYLEAVAAAGLRRAVVSSSANTEQVLRVTGLDRFIEARIDGVVAKERGLAGKPAPDTFLAGAQELGVAPDGAAVFEDATSGVRAGSAGGFGFVVGVDRAAQARALADSGADTVVADLGDLLHGHSDQRGPGCQA